MKYVHLPVRTYVTMNQTDSIGIEVEPVLYTVKGPIPFLPNERDVWVFCGKEVGLKGETISNFSSLLQKKGYSIQYYNKVFGGLTPDVLNYNFPDLEIPADFFSHENYKKSMREGLGMDLPDRCILFIHYCGKTDANNPFGEYVDTYSVFDALAPTAQEFFSKAYAYIESLRPLDGSNSCLPLIDGDDDSDGLLFRDGDEDDFDYEDVAHDPDFEFSLEMTTVAAQTYIGLRNLIISGYSIDVIESWLNKLSKRSRLVVAESFDIILPDYKNRIVKMDFLPKALFLFFLKHDRGFAIYQLAEHRDEILAIYERLTNSTEPDIIKERIDNLVASNGKSFIEKCSLIRKAFSGKVPERFIEDYYINGRQGEAKRIALDRSLVEWHVNI